MRNFKKICLIHRCWKVMLQLCRKDCLEKDHNTLIMMNTQSDFILSFPFCLHILSLFFQVLICAQVFYCFELHCICSWFAVCLLFVCCLFVVGLLFVFCLLLLCDISKSFRVGAEYSGISEAVSLYIYNVAHRVVAEQFITFHQEERLAATV